MEIVEKKKDLRFKKSAVLAAVKHILEMTRYCGNKVCLIITFYR